MPRMAWSLQFDLLSAAFILAGNYPAAVVLSCFALRLWRMEQRGRGEA